METTENIRPQLLADENRDTECHGVISRQAFENLATVTRDQLLADIGDGAMRTFCHPSIRHARRPRISNQG